MNGCCSFFFFNAICGDHGRLSLWMNQHWDVTFWLKWWRLVLLTVFYTSTKRFARKWEMSIPGNVNVCMRSWMLLLLSSVESIKLCVSSRMSRQSASWKVKFSCHGIQFRSTRGNGDRLLLVSGLVLVCMISPIWLLYACLHHWVSYSDEWTRQLHVEKKGAFYVSSLFPFFFPFFFFCLSLILLACFWNAFSV